MLTDIFASINALWTLWWFKCTIAFLALIVLDFAWARYNIACAEKKATVAGLQAILIYMLGGITVITYVEDHWMLLPATAGSFCGTFISVWTAKRGWSWPTAMSASRFKAFVTAMLARAATALRGERS